MPAINPSLLVWARETAGLSLRDAAAAIKLNAARGKTGAERLGERRWRVGCHDRTKSLSAAI
jgi:hypothetical protein